MRPEEKKRGKRRRKGREKGGGKGKSRRFSQTRDELFTSGACGGLGVYTLGGRRDRYGRRLARMDSLINHAKERQSRGKGSSGAGLVGQGGGVTTRGPQHSGLLASLALSSMCQHSAVVPVVGSNSSSSKDRKIVPGSTPTIL